MSRLLPSCWNEYILFNLTGTFNFIISQILYMVLVLSLKVNYLIAYIFVSVFSILLSYILNIKITFKGNHFHVNDLFKIVFVGCLESVFNVILLTFFVEVLKISDIIAPLIVPVISTVPVFILTRYILKKNAVCA